MSYHDPQKPRPSLNGNSLTDVLDWAMQTDEGRDAIYELRKVPARMGLLDEEMRLIPADLAHFDKIVATTPYGTVSKSKDLEKARKRGNARVRALLERFFAAQGHQRSPSNIRDSYTTLIDAIVEEEGFPEEGATFSTSTHKPFLLLRSRARVELADLNQDEIDRLWKDATSDGRKSIRKAINRIATLKRGHNRWPHIAALLPAAELSVPASPDRARRISWNSLPEGFRMDAEAVMQKSLRSSADLKDWARAQRAAGRPAQEIDKKIAEMRAERKRGPKNHKTAREGYQGALTWLLREQSSPETGYEELSEPRALFSIDALEKACVAQIERSNASETLKNPDESSTLWGRITNLTTIARHGLQDEGALAAIRVARLLYDDYIIPPDKMTADVEIVMDRLRRTPHLAATYVHAPARLHDLARSRLESTETEDRYWAEEKALRTFAAAAACAIQVSRPIRPANLFYTRDRATPEAPRNLTWIEDRKHAEIKFAGAEVKNGQAITVNVVGDDARVLWDWHKVHRPRFMKLRGMEQSPYLFPGTATPRLRGRLPLPPGSMSISALAELWDLGDRALGLGITPHQCRHATATLHLAVRPGDYATVAAILANTEEVSRAHYGKDSGEQAAAAVRASLLAHHPDIFKRLGGKI